MSAVLSYQFEEAPVRVVMIAGDPWFVASDLAKALGYRSANDLTRNLHDDERGTHVVRTPSADQDMNIISESGMYAAIFKSRRTEAERFRKWVTATVLPSIRKTGRFELDGYAPAPLPSDHDTSTLGARVAVVREARRLYGMKGARSIWLQLGLPQPIADAVPSADGDPWAERVRDYLSSRNETTTEQVAHACGIRPFEFAERRRVRALLDLYGWREGNLRREGLQQKMWVAPRVQEA